MAGDKQNKTEKPTHWRLKKAKEKGNVPRSRELAMSFSLLISIFFFALFAPVMGRTMLNMTRFYLGSAAEREVTLSSLQLIINDAFSNYLAIVGPLFLILICAIFLVNVVQGGFRIVPSNLKLKWEKLNFFKGLKKVVLSVESVFELVKSLVKVLIIGLIAYYSIKSDLFLFVSMPSQNVEEILVLMGRIFFKLILNIVIFLLILSVFDYIWVKWRYIQGMKMSKDEIKDEYKMHEGDPKIKSKRRSIQMRLAMQRMMAAVPKADVVITNPDHYAVALAYEYKKMAAPRVLAKGRGLVARRIKQIARENKVPLVENPPLARGLFAAAEVGDFIPAEYFRAVAEVLAYIYRLKGRKVA